MKGFFTKKVKTGFDETIEIVTAKLKEHGFGIITTVDVQATLKQKIDADFRPYRILGACNPSFAHKALLTEDKAGIMMPCNVVVQQHQDGIVEVILINPEAAAKAIGNQSLDEFACEVGKVMRSIWQQL